MQVKKDSKETEDEAEGRGKKIEMKLGECSVLNFDTRKTILVTSSACRNSYSSTFSTACSRSSDMMIYTNLNIGPI